MSLGNRKEAGKWSGISIAIIDRFNNKKFAASNRFRFISRAFVVNNRLFDVNKRNRFNASLRLHHPPFPLHPA